jgi:hypothetical protein
MATSEREAPRLAPEPVDIADDLDMPPERRALAKAHAAMLSATARKVSRTLPMSADVDDFRRVLNAEAKP